MFTTCKPRPFGACFVFWAWGLSIPQVHCLNRALLVSVSGIGPQVDCADRALAVPNYGHGASDVL